MTTDPNDDPWLTRWLPLLKERCGGKAVLELGCGGGYDTAVLVAAGHAVVPLDLDSERLARAQARLPEVTFHCRDLREPFPVEGRAIGAVVASLSLHYFPWEETVALASRIRDLLLPGGVLLCRLNATKDHAYGASGHPEISEHYYLVDGAPKRFFDEADVRRMFARGWSCLGLEEQTIRRFAPPKVAWEVVLETRPEANHATWGPGR